ncbi:MAG: GTP 3',8-cyclase MoaA [Natronospirillum sp.]
MFEDTFGRRFYYLRLSVTEVCNFRCTYCLPNGYDGPSPSAFLRRDELRRVMQVFALQGTRKIRLTGGEPSIRQDLPELISDARHTPNIERVAVTSNGYRLRQNVQAWIDAGLDQLNLSIDSLDPQQFHAITGHNRLKSILDGLELSLSLGLDVKVNAVYMRGVNDQLGSFLHWLRDTPITLRFIEVMETGADPGFYHRHHVPLNSDKQQLLLEGWQPVVQRRDAGPAQEFWHPDYRGRIGLIMPYSKDFCATCNRLRVSAQGNLHLCLFGEEGYNLRPWLQSDDQVEELAAYIQTTLGHKPATHGLHEHNPGITRNLSMLGG